jgi:gliding motility-associated-like protein
MNKIYHTLYKLLFLIGVFTYSSHISAQVAAGDSLALVGLYNSTAGAQWATHTNWLTGNVPTWYGVSVVNKHVSRLSLPSNNLNGTANTSLATLDSLVYLDLSNNNLTSFPGLTGLSLDTLALQGNALTFKDLVPNKTVADSFFYAPQDSQDVYIDTTVTEQNNIALIAHIDFNISIGDSYKWYKDSTLVQSSGADSYTILCMDSSKVGVYGCAVTNSQLPGLTIYRKLIDLHIKKLADPGTDFHVCASNSTLQGTAPAGGSVLWSVTSGTAIIANDSSAVTAITSLGIGPNVFQYSVTANNISCPANAHSVAMITVTRDTNPSPAYAGVNMSICGPQVILSADTPSVGIGKWTVISLGGATIAQPNDPTTAANGLVSGVNIFRWQIVNGACAPAYFSEVKVFRDDTLKSVSAGRDTSICPSSYTLSALLPADTHWSWSVVAGSGTFSSDSSSQTFENDTTILTPVTDLNEFLNTFKWTVSNTCNTISTNVNVTVYKYTVANAGPNENIFYSPINTYTIADTIAVGSGGNGQYAYQWSPSLAIDSSTAEHPHFLTPDAGTYVYSVTVTDGNGCTASSSVTYTVAKPESLTVPTLFTPNGDGINDVLYIPGIEGYPHNQLIVVDRNDQVVYKKDDYTNDWGGINELGFSQQGQKLPADTYFYTLKLEDGKALQTGFFLIKY